MIRPLALGALTLVGLLLLGAPVAAALLLAIVPLLSGLLNLGTALTFPAAMLVFAMGIGWTTAPMLMGQENFRTLLNSVPAFSQSSAKS